MTSFHSRHPSHPISHPLLYRFIIHQSRKHSALYRAFHEKSAKFHLVIQLIIFSQILNTFLSREWNRNVTLCWVTDSLVHCATIRTVAGSIPGCVMVIFHWHNPYGRTMVLGSTQPVTEMSTRCISWGGKGGRCIRLTTLPPSCAVVMKSENLNFLELSGPLQAYNGPALPLL